MTEQQVTGGRYEATVAACVYHKTGDPESEIQARIATSQGETVDLYLTEENAEKIELGDHVTVTVEITRDEQ